ncbi:MAG: hypothetical protein K6A69_10040, partial [Lachnospiraceae bacterium]|nr:hypothetical protein [Lachnospiraceae bacterium]
MIKKFFKKTAYVLLLSMILSLVPAGSVLASESGSENLASEKEALSSMKKVAENDSLELFFNEEDTSVAVKVKESGDIWFTNPCEADDDPVASAYQKRQLKSQLSVRYFNDNVQEATMDNYSDCVAEGNFLVQSDEHGLTVTYTLGVAAKKYLLPEVISVERL